MHLSIGLNGHVPRSKMAIFNNKMSMQPLALPIMQQTGIELTHKLKCAKKKFR